MTPPDKTAPDKPVRDHHPKYVIGWREWLTFPEFDCTQVKAKIDTGARTSSLHAWNIRPFDQDGNPMVAFDLHPRQNDNRTTVRCEARLADMRVIRSSTGHEQTRYVISTFVELGGIVWPIELSLARRDEMGFRMLLGRTAIRGRFLVDPGRSFVHKKLLQKQ